MKFSWATISIKDMEESLRFYHDLVGLPVGRRMKPSPDMELAFLGEGETKIELIHNAKAPAAAFGEGISLGFEVESLEKIKGVLEEKGIPIHAGPFQPNPAMRFLYVLDPNGLKIQFVENLK